MGKNTKEPGIIVHGGSYSQSAFAIGEYSRQAVNELKTIAAVSCSTANEVNERVWKQTDILTRMADGVIQSVMDALTAINNEPDLQLELVADRKMRLFNRVLKIQKTIAEMTSLQTFERMREVAKLGIAAEALLAKNADPDMIRTALAENTFDSAISRED